MVDACMYSSAKEDWETPESVFKPLQEEFGCGLDVCADEANRKCFFFISKRQDALQVDWSQIRIPIAKRSCKWSAWMNPPYGRQVTGKWVKKAYEESLKGVTVVCLLPSRTDTKWFHEYILDKAEIRFIKGRIKFVGAKHPAPFPSMIVVFHGKQ